jgi:hypothetical protein
MSHTFFGSGLAPGTMAGLLSYKLKRQQRGIDVTAPTTRTGQHAPMGNDGKS